MIAERLCQCWRETDCVGDRERGVSVSGRLLFPPLNLPTFLSAVLMAAEQLVSIVGSGVPIVSF